MNTQQSNHENQQNQKATHIIVNGRPRQIDANQSRYEEIIKLAFPESFDEQLLYSVLYTAPHLPDGTLAAGQIVNIENGMKFDVTRTNRS